ncbi:hypothetical protein ACROYT_G017750 [Oculina patagonica]
MMGLRCRFTILVALVLSSNFPTSIFTTGNPRQKLSSRPDKPTRVFIGENVSLAWRFYHPSNFKLYEVVLGIWKSSTLKKKLVAVNGSGFAQVRPGYESKVRWAGNLTSFLAVFVLYNVQPADGNKVFGMNVEYDFNTPLTDTVQLQVEAKPTADLPRITYVTTPPLLRIGQKVRLDCTASSLTSVNVTWYRGHKVLASGVSKAVFTLKNITDEDWGEFLCVAKNSDGEVKRSVILRVLPESPKILNTNKKVHNASWTLRWSAVYSGGQKVTLYTVWHRAVHVTNESVIREKPWLQKNVTGLMYHKELTADSSYMFAVTAWNRWGESVLESDNMLSISTDFPDRVTKKMDKPTTFVHTEPKTSVIPSSSKRKSVFMGKTELILYITLSFILCVLLLVVGVIKTKCKRSDKSNRRHQDPTGITPYSFTSQEDLFSEEAQVTPDERGSVILAESSLSMPESSLNSEQPTTSVRNVPGDCSQLRTGECFVLTAFRPEMNTIAPRSTSHEVPSLLRPFAPHRGSEGSIQNQDIDMPVIKTSTSKEQNEITKETNEATAVLSTVREEDGQKRRKGTTKFQAPDTYGQNGTGTDTFERVTHSEDYLQPVDNNNLQSTVINTGSAKLFDRKTQSLTHNRPQPKPRVKILNKRETDKLFQCKHSTFTGTLLSLQFTDTLEPNPLYDREAAQQCASVKPAEQSNHLIPQTKTRHGQHHGYQNDTMTTAPYQNSLRPAGRVESPYTRVLSNTNWEVSRDHLSLFERIGGGSFGQVWKGAALDVAGAKGWSIVAVKMLKENSSNSDLKDLLSELDVLKKLKPHPNVIQLLGCLTKDVIRCKGGREFRPPLVILEFVPHGDLLGYLKKSKGETDDYYSLKSAEVSRKIPKHQLYKFACDIARGMDFISAHQLIHRDLAARNVLVGEGLSCKITDFGMARDLGKNEIYVRRSNGLMPVKWMAVESLTSQVFTTESDVWSYGIVLYEIFTLGGRLYEGMTGEDVFNYVASGRRLPKTSAMTSELYNLMLQCWQENPYKRPTFGSIVDWMETVAQDH